MKRRSSGQKRRRVIHLPIKKRVLKMVIKTLLHVLLRLSGPCGDHKSTNKGNLNISVAEVLSKHSDLNSTEIAQLVGSTAGAVRSTKAWKNRKQLKEAPRPLPSGYRDVRTNNIEAEAKSPNENHFTVLELWQRWKKDGNSTPPPVETVAGELEVSEQEAEQIIRETQSLIMPFEALSV